MIHIILAVLQLFLAMSTFKVIVDGLDSNREILHALLFLFTFILSAFIMFIESPLL